MKQRYDEIGKKIADLYVEQGRMRDLMEEACTHENLSKEKDYSFLSDVFTEDEGNYKCDDCYRYFTKEEVEQFTLLK